MVNDEAKCNQLKILFMQKIVGTLADWKAETIPVSIAYLPDTRIIDPPKPNHVPEKEEILIVKN